MRSVRTPWPAGTVLVLAGIAALAGCNQGDLTYSERAGSPAPLRMPSPARDECGGSYEDSLTGGQVFSMYCSSCHFAPALSERPFSNFQNVAAHMRVRANLTGKEYDKLRAFLRTIQDVPPPPPTAPPEPSPKRFEFSQPLTELRDKEADKGADKGAADR